MNDKKEIYRWIIKGRYDIQLLLNDLYWHINANHLELDGHKVRRRIAGLLIGATFSLWRAVFLVDVEQREWGNILLAGEGFLKKVIETNSIGFADEHRMEQRTWVVGYYLNNARFRGVTAIREIEGEIKGGKERNELQEFITLREKLEIGISEEGRHPKEVWDESFEALKRIFLYLSEGRKR